MRLVNLATLAISVGGISGRYVEKHEGDQKILNVALEEPQYLIELMSGGTKWVTEAEKWQLRGASTPKLPRETRPNNPKDGQMFMDITDFRDVGKIRTQSTKKVNFPENLIFQDEVFPLLKNLNKSNIKSHLETFTSFHNRFYRSEYGEQSYKWLLKTINETIVESGADKYGVSVKSFEHLWAQSSIIVTIPGKTNSTVILGAHQDSINYTNPMTMRAPGADDDGSGTVTILEVLRTLLGSKDLVKGKAENTIEFHWYSGEEGGLLGSQAIFSAYEQAGRDVKAMLEQDMTGFVNLTVAAGKPVAFGLMLDAYDENLMKYAKLVIEEYTEIGWVETACGMCGSDHMSALRAGYPAVYIIEADFKLCDNHLHGSEDLIKYLDFDHMIDHAQMSLGFLYELAFTKL